MMARGRLLPMFWMRSDWATAVNMGSVETSLTKLRYLPSFPKAAVRLNGKVIDSEHRQHDINLKVSGSPVHVRENAPPWHHDGEAQWMHISVQFW